MQMQSRKTPKQILHFAHHTFLLCTVLTLVTSSIAQGQTPPRGPDFNHDWFDDLAIASPQEDWGAIPFAGMVSIGYGSGAGLEVPPGHLGHLTQDTPGIADPAEHGDLFGIALAWGDFDGDCFDDLAIGSDTEDINGVDQAGAIHVVYGSGLGLSGSGSQFIHRDTPFVAGVVTDTARFGSTLAAGDFDGDGFDDLAVAAEKDPSNGAPSAGTVHVFYGSVNGLSTANDHIFSRSSLGLETEMYFGRTLTTGDFDCDGRDDLAIGSPFADPENSPNGGDVVVLYGTPAGLSSSGSQLWYQGHQGLDGINEHWDHFGTALATGNFNGDVAPNGRQCLDLAIGVHLEDLASISRSGSVHVIYGRPGTGLQTSSPADRVFTQNSIGMVDFAERLDDFGYALVAGRFNNDDFDDLAIGVPGEGDGGAVAVLKGGANGLTTSGNVLWSQATAGVSDSSEMGDEFGSTLSYGSRFHWEGSTLLVGVPFEGLNGQGATGLTHALTFESQLSTSLVLLSEEGLEQSNFGGSSPEANDRFSFQQLAPRHVPFRCPM